MNSRTVAALVATFVLVPSLVFGAEANARVPLANIEAALQSLDGSYGDVPSSVNCDSAAPASAAALICADSYLKTAELLSTRASAYANENATGIEVDHKSWRGEIPEKCTTTDCIYDAFRQQTDDALGDESPYYYSSH